MSGIVYRLHRKRETPGERGIPKLPVQELMITRRGADDDFNRWREEKGAGDPEQALLLIPFETLAELNQEGWPVQPGDLGENITTLNFSQEGFQEGARFRIGDQLEIEITRPCQPCRHLEVLSYVGTERLRDFMQTLKDRRGWYASVTREGRISHRSPIVTIL